MSCVCLAGRVGSRGKGTDKACCAGHPMFQIIITHVSQLCGRVFHNFGQSDLPSPFVFKTISCNELILTREFVNFQTLRFMPLDSSRQAA